MNLCDPKTIKEIMSIFGLSFRKEFGQNFLTDQSVVASIADACDGASTVLEIGAGCGSLTHELALRYDRVIALEIDKGLIPLLRYTLEAHKNVELHQADVTKTDLAALLGDTFAAGPVSVCANLPYYITTPILLQLLESGLPFDCITLMIQKEVADRLCARPGDSDYGSVTAYLSYFGECEKLFHVPAAKFLPPPKVDSTVVRIRLYKEKPVKPQDEQLFFRVIRAAFGQRRKTLQNALATGIGELPKAEIAETIQACGFAADIRGERMSCADFAKISDALGERIRNA